ncbi:hypothetical protein ABH966_004687 [Lysinibacillus sp. RC46]
MIYESLPELLDQSHRIQPQNVNASYQVGVFYFISNLAHKPQRHGYILQINITVKKKSKR